MTDLQAEVERLKAENATLKALKAKPSTLTFKVSDKGAVSVYGMGRFPVTLYKEQWEKLLERGEDLKKFIADNQEHLVIKAGVRDASPTTPPPVEESPSPRSPAPTEIDDTVPF